MTPSPGPSPSRLTVLLDLSVLGSVATAPGIQRYVADLGLGLSRLAEEDPTLQLLAVESLPWIGRTQIAEDVPATIERLTARPRRRTETAWANQVRIALGRATRKAKPDILHSGHPNATPVGTLPCPRIVTCHDLSALAFPEHYGDWLEGAAGGRKRIDHRRFARADHVIATSRATADDLITRLDVPHQKITVVHNGVDLDRWSRSSRPDDATTRAALGLDGRPYLLCVGSANWRKNCEGVMEGLARARRLIGNEELVVAWAARLTREERTRIKRAAQEAGVADAVRCLGYVPDRELAALYRGATALVFVSRAEGFGYPVVEAMASGCPVITSNCSSLIEIAEGAALTVDPEDGAAIADAIVLLADDNAERRRLGEQGFRRAQRFSIRRTAERTAEVYRTLVHRSPG